MVKPIAYSELISGQPDKLSEDDIIYINLCIANKYNTSPDGIQDGVLIKIPERFLNSSIFAMLTTEVYNKYGWEVTVYNHDYIRIKPRS